MYCSKCGEQVSGDGMFCMMCGASLKGIHSSVENENKQEINNYHSKQENNDGEEFEEQASSLQIAPTKIIVQGQGLKNNIKVNIKLTKTQKLIALAIGIVFVLAIISYNIGALLTSREKVVAQFNKALISKNSSQLAKYIVSLDIKQEIIAKDLNGLLNYIDKNPSYRNEITKSIEKQFSNIALSSNLKDSSKDINVSGKLEINNTYDLFTLKKMGKTWVFYDRYVFELKPVYINVQTNYKDAQIFLGDNLICTADKQDYTKEVGPYIPGLYKIKAVLKGAYGELEKSIDVDLVSVDNSTNKNQKIKAVELYLEGYEVTVDSNYEDAKLFANGKDTGLLVKDAKEIGPISKDGSVKLYAQKEFAWGVLKSEEVKITKDSSIYLRLVRVNNDDFAKGNSSSSKDIISDFSLIRVLNKKGIMVDYPFLEVSSSNWNQKIMHVNLGDLTGKLCLLVGNPNGVHIFVKFDKENEIVYLPWDFKSNDYNFFDELGNFIDANPKLVIHATTYDFNKDGVDEIIITIGNGLHNLMINVFSYNKVDNIMKTNPFKLELKATGQSAAFLKGDELLLPVGSHGDGTKYIWNKNGFFSKWMLE